MTPRDRAAIPLFMIACSILSLILAVSVETARSSILQQSGDLMDAIETIRANMPGSGDEGFIPPSAADLDAWRTLIESLLDHDTTAVDSMTSTDFPFYELVHYTDTVFENHPYYLLRETLPVTKGWGTFILNPQHQRNIAIEVPHARYEINTPSEGTDIFRRTGSLLFIMTGTHRCSNDTSSPCDGTTSVCGGGSYPISDPAHYTDAVFQVAHEVFTDAYPQGYSFSLHGTSRSACKDIFLTNGTASGSDPTLFSLRDHMNASGNIVVSVAGDGTSSCPLVGSTNVQGRYTNGSLDPCEDAVGSNNGYFIHAEQSRWVRDNFTIYSKFIDAINDAIDNSVASVPDPPIASARLLLELSPAVPNPFGTRTRFSLLSKRVQHVTVEVIDVAGRRVVLLHDGLLEANESVNLSLEAQLPSGVYLVRATGMNVSVTRKITILR